MTKIFDLDGTERSAEWLAANYDGCAVLPANTEGASEVWRLAAVFVTEGPALFKAETRRKAGPNVVPATYQPVAFTWPSLTVPSQDLAALPSNPHNWSDRGVLDRTNADGLVGFGLGPVYGPFYHAWVFSSVPSDCLTKTGMRGGTNHRGPLHGVWALEPVEPSHASLREALLWRGERAQVIEFNPAAAIQARIFADGFVPNSPEFEVTFGGLLYIAQRAEHLSSGEVRIYYCRFNDWRNVLYERR